KLISRSHSIGRILIVLALLWVVASQPAVGQSCTIKDLGTLPGGSFSRALGINNRGEVAGEATTSPRTFSFHAFLFTGGVMVDLGTLPGGAFSIAYGINDRGQVVGFSNTASTFSDAFLFENGVMTD